jgi:hypothetical protein
MKYLLLLAFLFGCFWSVKAQVIPEFIDKPAFFDSKTKALVELEKSQYNTIAKAKGLFKAEAGFFLNGSSSPVKIDKQQELSFMVKVQPGTDPTSVFDLVQFDVKNDKRVFITSKATVAGSSNSFTKIDYQVKKIKEGVYYLIVPNLQAGEYFFGSKDFMFAFSIKGS